MAHEEKTCRLHGGNNKKSTVMINAKNPFCLYFIAVLVILPIVHCNPSKKPLVLNKSEVRTPEAINQPVQDTLPVKQADNSNQKPVLPPCQEPTNDSINEYKYPYRTVDVGQIAAILKSRNYSAIESVYVDVQNKFEKDFRNEFCLFDAYQMCIAAQPGMLAILEEWHKTYPGSANPLVADDMLFMSEIDPNGNAVTEDVYKPYPYSIPPLWGK